MEFMQDVNLAGFSGDPSAAKKTGLLPKNPCREKLKMYNMGVLECQY